MDHQKFEDIFESVKSCVLDTPETIVTKIEELQELSVAQKLEVADLIVSELSKESCLSHFSSQALQSEEALSLLPKMIVGRIIKHSANEILHFLEGDEAGKNPEKAIEFVIDLIDDVPVADILSDVSAQNLEKMVTYFLKSPSESVEKKLTEIIATENRTLQITVVKQLGELGEPFVVKALVNAVEKDEALGILIVNQLAKNNT